MENLPDANGSATERQLIADRLYPKFLEMITAARQEIESLLADDRQLLSTFNDFYEPMSREDFIAKIDAAKPSTLESLIRMLDSPKKRDCSWIARYSRDFMDRLTHFTDR